MGKRIVINIALFILSACSSISLVAQHTEQEKTITELMDNYNFSAAINLADTYLTADTGNIKLLLLKSKSLSGIFQYKQAFDVLKKAHELDTVNILVLAELSTLCQKKGDVKNAIQYCEKACNLKPQNTYFQVQLGSLYFSIEKFRKCRDILIPLYSSDSTNQFVIRTIADSYYEQRINDSAAFWYGRILVSSPYDLYATQKLANIFIRTDNFEKGLKLTENYIIKDTGLNPVLKYYAYFNYLLKDYNNAITNFKKCLFLGDSTFFVFKNLGLSFYKKEVFDSAGLFFRQAYLIDTSDGETCFYYGATVARSYLPDTGIIYLNKTFNLVMPSENFLSNIYFELAEAYNLCSKPDTALAILEKARCIYPENNRLLFRIAYQWDYYLKNPVNALTYYERFLKNKSNETEGYTGGATISFEDFARNRISEIKKKNSQKKQ